MDEETGLMSERSGMSRSDSGTMPQSLRAMSLSGVLQTDPRSMVPSLNGRAHHSNRGKSWGGASDLQSGQSTPSGSSAISRSTSRGRDMCLDGLISEAFAAKLSKLSPSSFSNGSRRSRSRKTSQSDAAKRWDPTVWGSLLIVAIGCATTLAWYLTNTAVQAPQPDACITYVPKKCLLKTRRQTAFQPPQCVPRPCAFSTEEVRCPFAASGVFMRTPKTAAARKCADPFMESTQRRMLPPCGRACCGGEMPGSFLKGESDLPGSQTWQPRRASDTPYTKKRKPTCSFFQYSAVEVLQYLQSNQARVLVMGDSIQKEMHSRLIHMFRGSSRVIDYRILAMARYALCRRADSFSVLPGGYDSSMRGIDPEPTLKQLPEFVAAAPSVWGCSRNDPPVVFDNVYSARFDWQIQHLKAYRAAMPPEEVLILVIAVNLLETGNEVPLEWLQYLDDIRNDVKIILVATPTDRLVDQEIVKVLQYRNKVIKSWAASIDAISFVDMDAMARDPHRPPHSDGDMHNMCWLRWAGHEQGSESNLTTLEVPRAEDNVLRDRQHGSAVIGIQTTTDGQCRDEMNLNLWQIVFNIFMKWNPIGNR